MSAFINASGQMTDVGVGNPLPTAAFFAPVGAQGMNAALGTAVPLTPPAGATTMMMQAQAQNVRYTLDGSPPTATGGFQLFAGDTARIRIGAGMVLTVVQETAGAVLAYQWGV